MANVVAILDFLSDHFAILCLISALMLIIIWIQLDYRGDVQNMNSQHFSYIMYRANTNAWGSKFDLAILFVCVEVLRPSQPNGVMSSAVSLPNHTFTGQA